MKRKSRIYKKKKGFRRGFALLMTAALVICGSNLTVLAEENDSNDKVCICESRCSEEEIQEECPVCVENYEDCMYQENPESEEEGEEISGQENDQGAAEGDNTDVNGSGDEGTGNSKNEGDTNENESINDDMKEGDPANDDNIVEELDKEELLKGTDLPEMQGALASSAMEMEAAEGGTFGEEEIETYAVGDQFEDSNGVIYEIISDSQVEVQRHRDGEAVSGGIVIPEEIDFDGNIYRVTSIGANAFKSCTGLTSIEMPDSVTSIGANAFEKCYGLINVKMSDSLTSIGSQAFDSCSNLTGIEIPDNVTDIGMGAFIACRSLISIKIPDGVTDILAFLFYRCESLTNVELPNGIIGIQNNAFWSCSSLINIELPDGLTNIGAQAFYRCSSLSGINVPSSVSSIGEAAFRGCSRLSVLKIAVPSNGSINVPTVDVNAFKETANDRILVFCGEDGVPLSGNTLEAAQIAYRADKGGENNSDYWWGWKIGAPGISPIKNIEIKVNKDNSEWKDHTKKFGLKLAGDTDAALLTDFMFAVDGEYRIFDVTNVGSILDTEVNIIVNGNVSEAVVDYYTITFFDGDVAYADGTHQAPQIILKGQKALQPEEPSKPGYRFRQWTTINHGSEAFRFDLPVTQKSSVYADWIEEAADEYIIAASAGEGGKIFPEGNVRVAEGGAQTFEITPNDGYRIKSVIADGMDVTDKLTDSVASGMAREQAGTGRYYTFLEVREDHRIQVVFETETDGGSGGNGGNTENGGSGDNDGNTGNGGSSGNGGSDNPESNDNSGITAGSVNENPGGESARDGVTAGNAHGRNSGGADKENGGSAGTSSKNAEPKTGDLFQVEIYATVAMVAGLAYLMLRFADREGGMTEDEKQELIMKMILWAKRGSHIRKYAVLAPIFILLVYYHSIGKSVYVEWENSLMVGEGHKPNRVRRSRIQK